MKLKGGVKGEENDKVHVGKEEEVKDDVEGEESKRGGAEKGPREGWCSRKARERDMQEVG